MRIICILVGLVCEHEHTKNGIQEDKEQQKTTNICQLRQGTNESEEQDSQTFVLLNNLEYSEASESLDNSHNSTKL